MDESTRIHQLDMKITKHFHRGIELFNQGFAQPLASPVNPSEQAQLAGWKAAKDMDVIKKSGLQQLKDEWVK